MAIDEVLMTSQENQNALPTLRFYRWSSPAYSIGYFQSVETVLKRFDCAKKKISVVRRLTGGGLVFHGEDLTFSLSMKNPNPFFAGDVKDSYLKVNEALRVGIQEAFQGLDYADCKTVPSGRATNERVCFEAPSCYDLLLKGKKVVGASQRRLGEAILHQSSVFLDNKHSALEKNIQAGFERVWKINFKEMPLTQEELNKAGKKEKERYANPEWAFLIS